MRLKLEQRPSAYPPQIQHQDLSNVEDSPDTVENLADSIVLLRDENDRSRKMAASLNVEAENIRQSLSPTKANALLV